MRSDKRQAFIRPVRLGAMILLAGLAMPIVGVGQEVGVAGIDAEGVEQHV